MIAMTHLRLEIDSDQTCKLRRLALEIGLEADDVLEHAVTHVELQQLCYRLAAIIFELFDSLLSGRRRERAQWQVILWIILVLPHILGCSGVGYVSAVEEDPHPGRRGKSLVWPLCGETDGELLQPVV